MKVELYDSFGDLMVVGRMPEDAPNPLDVSVKFYVGSDAEDEGYASQMSLSPYVARDLAAALIAAANNIEKGQA